MGNRCEKDVDEVDERRWPSAGVVIDVSSIKQKQ